MSSEEDAELKDLVTQALESNGVLSKIRAELRARVFLALEEHDFLQTEDAFMNPTFKSFIRTSEGALLTCLVREFLEFFGLDFTLSVYDPETCCGKDYKCDDRNLLIKNLHLKLNGAQEPLLAHILRQASCPQPAPSPQLNTQEGSCGGSASALERKTDTEARPQQPLLRQPAVEAAVEQEPVDPIRRVPESSESDTTIPHAEEVSAPLHSKKETNPAKPTTALDHPEGSYDEDFQSSGSGSAREIEEDLGSGIDDLLSNASGLEDLTADATVSHASGAGDYLESL